MNGKLILVTGATGRQGGAVVRHALRRGFKVRAITRNPASPKARALASAGAEVVPGDMEEPSSLKPALAGVYGVFSVQNFWERGVGQAGEIRQARNLAEAARDASVSHFVQSSIAGCENAAGVEHFESKHEIEKIVEALRLPRTFIRTVLFMESFLDPQLGPLLIPVLAGALQATTRLHMLAVDDIGWFAAESLANPGQYLGKTIDIAGDSLTVDEMKQVIARSTGKRAANFKFPVRMLRLMNAEMARQLHWNNEIGWRFDIQAVRAIHPSLISFETFLKTPH